MNNYKCPNAVFIRNGISESVRCTALNDFCGNVRYCATKNGIEHTDFARYCPYNPEREEYTSEKNNFKI